MKRILPLSAIVCFVLFLQEKANSQLISLWGKSVKGVQMSIALTNGIIFTGSTIFLNCMATNSTRDVVIFAGDPNLDLQIILLDKSGNTHNLSRFPDGGFRPGGGPGFCLQPREVQTYQVPIFIPTNIPAEPYQMNAEIKIRIPTASTNPATMFQFPKLVSNSLDVQIK